MSNKKYTLVINPGATSTKAAIYEGETEVFTENLSHPIGNRLNFQFSIFNFQFNHLRRRVRPLILEEGLPHPAHRAIRGSRTANLRITFFFYQRRIIRITRRGLPQAVIAGELRESRGA